MAELPRQSDTEARRAMINSPGASNQQLLAIAYAETVRAGNAAWNARLALSELNARGERVLGAYERAVKTTTALDRALSSARKPKTCGGWAVDGEELRHG